MKNKQKGFISLTGFVLIIYLVFLTGYVMNIVKFVRLDFKAPYKAEVIRGIGIVPPIGGVLGYIKVTDK